MSLSTLKTFLKGIRKQHSTQVYQCDALWIIGNALGNKFGRYSEIVKDKKAPVNTRTTEDVVNELVDVLTKDAERRMKDGKHSV